MITDDIEAAACAADRDVDQIGTQRGPLLRARLGRVPMERISTATGFGPSYKCKASVGERLAVRIDGASDLHRS